MLFIKKSPFQIFRPSYSSTKYSVIVFPPHPIADSTHYIVQCPALLVVVSKSRYKISCFPIHGRIDLQTKVKLPLPYTRTLKRKVQISDKFFSWYFLALQSFWSWESELLAFEFTKPSKEKEDNLVNVVKPNFCS